MAWVQDAPPLHRRVSVGLLQGKMLDTAGKMQAEIDLCSALVGGADQWMV